MAGTNRYDQIINGSFDAIGAPPSYISPPYNPADYASIFAGAPQPSYQPNMMGRGLPLSASSRLPTGTAGIDPIGWTPPAPPAWGTPTSIDLAAIDAANKSAPGVGPSLNDLLAYAKGLPDKKLTPAAAAAARLGNPVTKVTAPIKAQPHGGLLDLLFGQSKNGLGGLPGLLGGSNAGGLLGLLSQPRTAAPMPISAPRSTATGTSSNGYVYSNGQNVGKAPQYAGLTPSQMYDAINAAAGNSTSSGNSGSRDPESQARANYSMASSH